MGTVLQTAYAQSQLPKFNISDLEYRGAFRLSANQFGNSSLNYSEGPIYFSAKRNSIFIVGHAHDQAIAEFPVPALVKSTDLAALNIVNSTKQNFSSVLNRASAGNAQKLDRIGGLAEIDGKLFVNTYEYYDAPADNTKSLLRIENPNNIETSAVTGYFSVDGGPGHTAGWISPVPENYQAALGGTHITGFSSGVPIISRTSVGPSAFAFVPSLIGNSTVASVPSAKLLDFSLEQPLASDLSNTSRTNKIWTHLSRATYGFIVPGSSSYLTIGYSGGHESGVCYKCTQSDGNLCGGYCAPDANDYSSFFWLWNMEDLVKVKAGQISAHSVRPYSFGKFELPIPAREIGGASFDPKSGQLFLSLQAADRLQGEYSNPPVIAVFKVGQKRKPNPPTGLRLRKRSS